MQSRRNGSRLFSTHFLLLLRTKNDVAGSCCLARWVIDTSNALLAQNSDVRAHLDPSSHPLRVLPRHRCFSFEEQVGSVHASTSAEVLEGLVGKHPVVAPILEFRGVNKYKTT